MVTLGRGQLWLRIGHECPKNPTIYEDWLQWRSSNYFSKFGG